MAWLNEVGAPETSKLNTTIIYYEVQRKPHFRLNGFENSTVFFPAKGK